MNTTVKSWYIVTVLDGEKLVGEVLYGTIKEDATIRFYEGDYVTTSRIVSIDVKTQQIITASNSCYALKGRGKRAISDIDDFELLRHGFSPEQFQTLIGFTSLLMFGIKLVFNNLQFSPPLAPTQRKRSTNPKI